MAQIAGLTGDYDLPYYRHKTRIVNSEGHSWSPQGDNIQRAIDDLTYGKVWLPEGLMYPSAPITYKAGVSLEGILPTFEDVEPNPPDFSGDLVGGTVLVGDGTFDCFVGNKIKGIELKNLGMKNFRCGLDFGATDTLGLAMSKLGNLYFKTMAQRAIKITNLQHVRMDNIFGMDVTAGLMHLVHDHTWNGGNSLITDVYGYMPAGVAGIKIEAVKNVINLIEFHRPQINFHGAGGGYAFHLVAPSGTNFVQSIDVHSLDTESMTGHVNYNAVRAEGKVQWCLFHNAYFAGTTAFDLITSGGNSPKFNLLISPEVVNVGSPAWENIFLGTIGSGNLLGYAINNDLGTYFSTILAGDKRTTFLNYLAMLESGRANTVKSPTFAIDSTGLKTITIPHALAFTPRKEDCQISVIEETNVDDWAYNLLKVDSADATNVIVKLYVSTASVTGGATARIGLRVERRG